jgi:23S rRNA pseudoU1915 N3-methylase RlmH
LTAKGVQFVVTNTDKTLLYADIKENNDDINTFGYEIPVGTVTIWSEREGTNKRVLDNEKISDVARLIVNYVKANKALAVQAAEIKAKTTAFNQKANARAAAEKERIAKEVEKAHARLDRRDAAKQLKNSNKVDDVASSLWGSDEEYDKFLDSLL